MGNKAQKGNNRRQDIYYSFSNNHQSSHTTSLAVGEETRQKVTRKIQPQIQTKTQYNLQHSSEWIKKVFFTPQSTFIIVFDMIKLVVIYLYFIEIPITIAFENHRKQEDSQKIFELINIPAIVIFLLSIIVQLKTAYYSQGLLISDQGKIIQNYFLYHFIFDFLSITSICIYEFSEILHDHNQSPISYRFIVILFYIKIPQVFSIEKSMIAAFDLKRRAKSFLKLTLLIVKIFLISNVAACGFFYLSDSYCPEKKYCWVETEFMGKALKHHNWSTQYAFALYWASTTMLTIGYGDITPQNSHQVQYTIGAQFISCMVFAFSINEIWSIILQKNTKKQRIRNRLNVMNVYMRDKGVKIDLKSRINAYLSNFYYTKNLREKELENQIIEELTPSLKKQLYFQSYGFIFKTHKFFKIFNDNFLEQVSEYIKQIAYFQEEIIFKPHCDDHNSLYFMQKGQLNLMIDLGNSQNNLSLQTIENQNMIGLYDFVRQIDYRTSLIAKKYSLLYLIDNQNWINHIKKWQEDFQIFSAIKHEVTFSKKVQKLFITCKICGEEGHCSQFCLDLQIRKVHNHFLSKYLRNHPRKKHKRIKLRSELDFKSGRILQSAIEEEKLSLSFLRSNSYNQEEKWSRNSLSPTKQTNTSAQRILATMHQKKLFSGELHQEKINKIVARQKLKQSIMSDNSQTQEFIVNQIFLETDKVHNYEFYHPKMNSSADWGKERRKMTTLSKLMMNRTIMGKEEEESSFQKSFSLRK